MNQGRSYLQATPHDEFRTCSNLKNLKLDFRTLIETTNVMVLIFQNNSICYANPIVEDMIGYTQEELFDNKDLSQQFQLTQDQEISLLRQNGTRCWLDCSIRLIQFAQQSATLVTVVDVTRYKQRDRRAKELSQKESNFTQDQGELISTISHELRTPLNVILFSHNLLKRYCNRWSGQKKQEYFDRINRSIETMNLLIDEFSIIGKAKAKKLIFEPRLLEVSQFCQTLLSDLYLADERIGLVDFRNLGGCCKVLLDRNLLQLILTNLLENAIKYSPQDSSIDFTLAVNDKEIIFTIQDWGIGIAAEDLQQLFKPFYRGNNVGELPGTGLGLTTVKKLVDVHGGSLKIDSQLEIGTEVIVSLPKKINQI